jgi:hypothetical protein
VFKYKFGKKNQVQFNSENEYYQALGYLAKSDGSSSIHWEHNENQGAWGSEGRIHFYVQNSAIQRYFKLTAGNENVVSRVNCNEFVENLKVNHMFIMGKKQESGKIRNTVPKQFQADFDHGLTL